MKQHIMKLSTFFVFAISIGITQNAFASHDSYDYCGRYDSQIERIEYQIERMRDYQNEIYDRLDDLAAAREQALLRIETQYENLVARYEDCDNYQAPYPGHDGHYGTYSSSYSSYYPSYCRNAEQAIARAEEQRDRRIHSTNLAYDRREEFAQVQAQKRYESLEFRIEVLEDRMSLLEEQKDDCEEWYSW